MIIRSFFMVFIVFETSDYTTRLSLILTGHGGQVFRQAFFRMGRR